LINLCHNKLYQHSTNHFSILFGVLFPPVLFGCIVMSIAVQVFILYTTKLNEYYY